MSMSVGYVKDMKKNKVSLLWVSRGVGSLSGGELQRGESGTHTATFLNSCSLSVIYFKPWLLSVVLYFKTEIWCYFAYLLSVFLLTVSLQVCLSECVWLVWRDFLQLEQWQQGFNWQNNQYNQWKTCRVWACVADTEVVPTRPHHACQRERQFHLTHIIIISVIFISEHNFRNPCLSKMNFKLNHQMK